eukprot:COSAG03_NODE_991_length_5084_cov_86.524774_10_plen_277_part_00
MTARSTAVPHRLHLCLAVRMPTLRTTTRLLQPMTAAARRGRLRTRRAVGFATAAPTAAGVRRRVFSWVAGTMAIRNARGLIWRQGWIQRTEEPQPTSAEILAARFGSQTVCEYRAAKAGRRRTRPVARVGTRQRSYVSTDAIQLTLLKRTARDILGPHCCAHCAWCTPPWASSSSSSPAWSSGMSVDLNDSTGSISTSVWCSASPSARGGGRVVFGRWALSRDCTSGEMELGNSMSMMMNRLPTSSGFDGDCECMHTRMRVSVSLCSSKQAEHCLA